MFKLKILEMFGNDPIIATVFIIGMLMIFVIYILILIELSDIQKLWSYLVGLAMCVVAVVLLIIAMGDVFYVFW